MSQPDVTPRDAVAIAQNAIQRVNDLEKEIKKVAPDIDRCHFCNETRVIEQHHIVPKRYGGPDTPANLLNLCPTCHEKIEQIYDDQFFQSLGVAPEAEVNTEVEPIDHIDRKVIASFEEGESVAAPLLKNRYIDNTRVNNQETARKRARQLANTEYFEKESNEFGELMIMYKGGL